MNVCVIGYGHFASIVAAVVASRGHVVMQADEEPHLVRANQIAPDAEPGYTELAQGMRDACRLVSLMPRDIVDVYWIAYDVPLDADGAPEITEVTRRIIALDQCSKKSTPFIVSCQWPVGTTAETEAACPDRKFVYVLENVRAGKAVADFQDQRTIIAGLRRPWTLEVDRSLRLLQSVCCGGPILMMSPESAELSKHALNAFMALQIAFVNEIADVAPKVSADPVDVSRALLSDPRVSPLAPLKPGKPFGGGSLQRDLLVLEQLSDAPILHAIRASNDSRS